ncbi:MAG: hybrid sensor histidine kinase/response regulator [Myxococcota bacterium]|nr:hybrid sensor histidine kinase/response regulator [Myxococcota bacterium]
MPSPKPAVLVVDDEPRALELLARTLRKQANVATAQSGDEAWKTFQQGDFALVISDQRMPGMGGVDLLGRVADHDETVGRILLTGYTDLDATVAAINRGRVHAYLHKPCAPPDLQTTVKGVLDRVELSRENLRLLGVLRERNQELADTLASLEAERTRSLAAERLAAIGRTTAMIVHDLRGPLTVLGSLRGEVYDAARSGEVAELERVAQELDVEVVGLARMCEKLLESTRVTGRSQDSELGEIDDIVNSALVGLGEYAGRDGIEIEMDLHSGADLPVDEDGLRRALRNLATNAIEAMPDGGTLRVESFCESDDVVLRVTDTGVGIPDEIADRLFEPFVTAGKPKGTGLGLAVVQKVVHDHQGTIELSKPEGGGSAFTVRLPVRGAR